MTQTARDALDQARKRIFEEAQAKLTLDDRCADAVEEMCMAEDDDYTCTKKKHHNGDHVAHGVLGYAMKRWPA